VDWEREYKERLRKIKETCDTYTQDPQLDSEAKREIIAGCVIDAFKLLQEKEPTRPVSTTTPPTPSYSIPATNGIPTIESKIAACHREAEEARNPKLRADFLNWCLADIPTPAQTPATPLPAYTNLLSKGEFLSPTPTQYKPKTVREIAQELAEILIENEDYEKMIFILECRIQLPGGIHRRLESLYSVRSLYKTELKLPDKAIHVAWEKTLEWAETKGLIGIYKHGGDSTKQIFMGKRGAYLINTLIGRGYTLQTIMGFADAKTARGGRRILWRLLRDEIGEAEALISEYKIPQQYYRDLVNIVQEYRKVVQEMRKINPASLGLLDEQVIHLFKEGKLDEEGIAAKLNMPLAYVKVLSLIQDNAIPNDDLISILGTTNKHIRDLKFLLKTTPPHGKQEPSATPPIFEPISKVPEQTPSPPVPMQEPTLPPPEVVPEVVPEVIPRAAPKQMVEQLSGIPIEEKLKAAKYARIDYDFRRNKDGPFQMFLVYPNGSEEPFAKITNKERLNINADFVKHKLTPDRVGKHLKHLKLRPSEIQLLYDLINERMEERLMFESPEQSIRHRRGD
jgi:hypothetical protein